MTRIEVIAARLAGVYGAARYRLAVLQGDVAEESVIETRRTACRGCSVRWRGSPGEGIEPSDFCDVPAPLTPKSGGCGCNLVAKTSVGSERCPLGKW